MPSQIRDHGALAAAYRDRAHPDAVARLATQLGVTAASLDRLGIGWDGRNWTFPMSDADGLVRGIRLRTPGGRKFTVSGGKHGLHVPAGLSGLGPVLLPEGPTDTAAGLDLRFDVIGRPSCRGAARLIVEFIKRHKPETVVVVADADAPGRAGAAELAAILACYHRDVRVIEPPAKDLREWLNAGATAADINDIIALSEPMRVRIGRRGGAA